MDHSDKHIGLNRFNSGEALSKCNVKELRRMINLYRNANGPGAFVFRIPAMNARRELRHRGIHHSRLSFRRKYW